MWKGGYIENILTKYVKNVDAIDMKECDSPILKKNKKIKYIIGNFLSYNFDKKYDLILFSNSIQFILGENPKKIDNQYREFVENKIISLLKPQRYIFIYITTKKWFLKYKPFVGKTFLKSLNWSADIINNMKFKKVHEIYTDQKYNKIIIFQNE